MNKIEQHRTEAMARMEKRRVELLAEAVRMAKANQLRRDGKYQVLLIEAEMPLVRVGGGNLHELREDVYDNANNTVRFSQYDAAMMGGEPFAIWN